MTYGGTVVSLTAPDRNGKFADVVLGADSLEGYLKQTNFFGAIIGRYGNRIGHGIFKLDGKAYTPRRTTATTPCTAARKASTNACGKPRRRARLKARAWN